ncbi:MAG: hypothetical protein H6581_28255 [Bacteroidia bacterium]|nr:hypothetical protein [Bacteroidia bacterium]
MGNTISPFEYVSILISIILGLGITQMLASLSDLLYDLKKVRFYWPHLLWVVFILFLHIQEWFSAYKLKDKAQWLLPELFFVLLYPISLYATAKMLLPTNEREEKRDMKAFYYSQYQVIFIITAFSIVLSIISNVFLMDYTWLEQIPIIIFLGMMLTFGIRRTENEWIHRIIALLIFLGALLSTILVPEEWVIQ